jgi:FkbM family methyltransferase
MLKKLVKTILPNRIVRKFYEYYAKSFSQQGEDIVLRKVFQDQPSGFYIDIGAHHPQRFSNTYYFYLQGWRGINVDAMPGSMELFKKKRPRDINLEVAISSSKQTLKYYMYNEPALNTFSSELVAQRATRRDNLRNYKITSELKISTCSLEEVLDRYLPANSEIDFLDVDVEGFDFQVLESNNWNKYRPKIVLAEQIGTSISEISKTEIGMLMKENNYNLYSFIRKQVAIYKDNTW